VTDPVLALAIDDAVAQRLLAHDAAQRLGRGMAGHQLPPGQEYEDTTEVLAAERGLQN
jgi:hypothetical protein